MAHLADLALVEHSLPACLPVQGKDWNSQLKIGAGPFYGGWRHDQAAMPSGVLLLQMWPLSTLAAAHVVPWQ